MSTNAELKYEPQVQVSQTDSGVEFVFHQGRPAWFRRALLVAIPVGFLAILAAFLGEALQHSGAPWWISWTLLLSAAIVLLGLGIPLLIIWISAIDKAEVHLTQEALVEIERGQELRIPRSEIAGLRIEEHSKRGIQFYSHMPITQAFSFGPDHAYLIITAWGAIRVLGGKHHCDLSRMHRVLVGHLGVSEGAPVQLVADRNEFVGPVRWAAILFLIAIAAAMGYLFLQDYQIARKTAVWPSVQGTVLQAEARREGDTYHAKMEYAYDVGSRSYKSERISFTHTASDGEVTQLIHHHPKGTQVTVYYDPANPSEATLMQGISPFDWIFLPPGCILSAFAAGFLAIRWPSADTVALLARYPLKCRDDRSASPQPEIRDSAQGES